MSASSLLLFTDGSKNFIGIDHQSRLLENNKKLKKYYVLLSKWDFVWLLLILM